MIDLCLKTKTAYTNHKALVNYHFILTFSKFHHVCFIFKDNLLTLTLTTCRILNKVNIEESLSSTNSYHYFDILILLLEPGSFHHKQPHLLCRIPIFCFKELIWYRSISRVSWPPYLRFILYDQNHAIWRFPSNLTSYQTMNERICFWRLHIQICLCLINTTIR